MLTFRYLFISAICCCCSCCCVVSAYLINNDFDVNKKLEFSIFEETPVGSTVGELPNSENPYQLSHSTFSHYFSISDNKLLVAKLMDRDNICSQNLVSDCIIGLTLVQPSASLNVIRLDVILKDVNDNAPVFSSEQLLLEVSENAHIGAQLYLPTAMDADSGSNGIRTYRFLSSNNDLTNQAFQLKTSSTTSEDGDENSYNFSHDLDLQLVVSAALDRENVDQYNGWLVAIDGGEPAKTGKLEIIIRITDSNDNSPKFEKNSYVVSVPEDLQLGAVVLNVSATDADEGENGRVVYTLAKQPSSDEHFSVDSTSGVVYLIKNLDFEKQTSHSIVISAKDSGPGSIAAYARAVVHVTDINDNHPAISFNGEAIKVPENKDSGLFVAQFSVEDKDKGENGIVNCWLEDESTFELKQHHSSMLVLVSRISFDREVQNTYQVRVTCRDRGWPGLETTEVFEVQIEDENDNAPIFSSSLYAINALESFHPGSKLSQVQAIDADAGRNADITYRSKISRVEFNPNYELKLGAQLSAEDVNTSGELTEPLNKSSDIDEESVDISQDKSSLVKHWFQVDERIGLITVGHPIDYEFAIKVYLEVIAQDNGTPTSQSSTARVVINILDVNDEAPKFSRQAYSFGVSENQPAGIEIGHVSASDLDTSPYNRFRFAFPEAHSLHHYHHQHYHSHRQGFHQNVLANYHSDDLDVSPTTPTARIPTTHVKGPNFDSTISFHSSSTFDKLSNPQEWFSIDPATGKITTVRSLDREQHSVHRFWVTAVDLNHPFFASSAEVTVNVADKNDNAPLILFPPNQNFAFHVPLAAHKDYVVARVLASDADVGENARLVYSIVKGNDDELFYINPINGEITVARDEAFASKTSQDHLHVEATHRLLVMVKDSGTPEKMAVTNIEVCINKTLQLFAGHSDTDQEGFNQFFSWSDFDLTSFTGKYILCLIVTVSFILVLIVIVLAIFTRRVCLRRKRKQTLVMLKKANFNNDPVKSTTSFTIIPKNSNVNYTGSNHLGTTTGCGTIDRNSPYFKSIDISNDLNYVPSENYYSPRLASMKMNGTTTFQRPNKTTCHEEAILRSSDKDGHLIVKDPAQEDPTWVKTPNSRLNSGGHQEANRLLGMLRSERIDNTTTACVADQQSTFRIQKTTI